jgi:hypothetical protein
MPFLTELSIDGGKIINVLNCDYRFSQTTNATGKVTSIPTGGYVNLTIESTDSVEVFDWMIHPTSIKNGIITFFRRDVKSKMKTLEFTDAYCVEYHESYDHLGEHPMQITFTLSAKKLKLNDSEFVNNRPDAE